MRLIGGYLVREIALGILMVLLGFLGLFAFFDLIRELDDVGKADYRIQHAIAYVALGLPSHVYELMPVAALIGSIYALAQFASTSEFTAMRAAGMSRAMALRSVVGVGIVLAVLTAVAGEWVAPVAQQLGTNLRAATLGKVPGRMFRSGLWIKDSRVDPQTHSRVNRFVNIGRLETDGRVTGLEIYEFDDGFRLESVIFAKSATYVRPRGRPQGGTEGEVAAPATPSGAAADAAGAKGAADRAGSSAPPAGGQYWRLDGVERTDFRLTEAERGGETLRATYRTEAELDWESELTPELLAVLSLDPDRMSAYALWNYVAHLKANGQNANRYEVALWKKIIYPLAIIVMLMLALPFGYIQARAGSVGLKLFTGIMIGVAFYFFNGLMSNLGLLNTWPPWVAVSIPSLVALVLALVMLARVGRT